VSRVTVVNDSTDFLDLMRELIDDLGHDMTGLVAVKSTIHEVVDTEPELLVVDLVMGNTPQEVSGWELLLLARSHRALRDVPVILCTADIWEVKQRAADLEQISNVHVLTKPFMVDEMAELIGDLLGTDFETLKPSQAQLPAQGTPPPA
jgi:CheY-like chemotaxis protein